MERSTSKAPTGRFSPHALMTCGFNSPIVPTFLSLETICPVRPSRKLGCVVGLTEYSMPRLRSRESSDCLISVKPAVACNVTADSFGIFFTRVGVHGLCVEHRPFSYYRLGNSTWVLIVVKS